MQTIDGVGEIQYHRYRSLILTHGCVSALQAGTVCWNCI
jgi:hypothetical protein